MSAPKFSKETYGDSWGSIGVVQTNPQHSSAVQYTHCIQGDHSPYNVKFPDGSWHLAVKCYSYNARTSVTVSRGGRNATVHDPKSYI